MHTRFYILLGSHHNNLVNKLDHVQVRAKASMLLYVLYGVYSDLASLTVAQYLLLSQPPRVGFLNCGCVHSREHAYTMHLSLGSSHTDIRFVTMHSNSIIMYTPAR